MRRVSAAVLAVSSLLVSSTFVSSALAADGDEAKAAAPPATAAPAADAPVAFKPIALTANPLSLLIGRYGLNIEYLPAEHHGIMLNPYFSSQSLTVGDEKSTYKSFGAELGYHFYTGTKGANGFFVGPQLVFIHANDTVSCTANDCGNLQASAGFTAYGVAVDLGGQHVFDNGFTIGGGAGVMYLHSSATASGTSSTIKFDGTLPRFLFTIGYSFGG